MSIDQLFNKALNKGLSDFRGSYRYDKNCNKHGERLGNAEKRLRNTLIKTNDAPCYGDPFIVDAYLSTYHLQHCRLAYWVFKYFFNQFDVPNALYVCDVGAGTQAGCVGLALVLSEYREKPAIYFDAYEPSDEMRNAGYCFWSAFRDSVGANFDPHPWSTLPHRLPDDLPANALRVVTAFHLSLPYNNKWYENNIGEKARNSLQKAFRLVSPEYGFFTCHKDKEDSLCQAVDNSCVWKKEKRAKPYLPDRITPYLSTDSIFLLTDSTSLPTDSILLLREAKYKASEEERLRELSDEAKRKAAEQERLQEWKKAEAKRKINEQEKLKRERLEREQSKEAEAQRRAADEDEAKRKAAKEKRARLGLSTEDALPDPWDNISSYLKVDDERIGKVEAIQDYGLFVNVEDGLVGLVRISPQGYYKVENFDVGDEVRVRVSSISPKRKRIAFRLLPPLS